MVEHLFMVEAAAHRDHLVVSEHENFISRGYTVYWIGK